MKNKPHGKGKISYKEGLITFEGEIKNGLKEGAGELSHKDGWYLKATWRKDEMEGQGYLLTPNHDRYEGMFKEGKPSGRGVLLSGQTTYKGQFLNGLKHGKGELEDREQGTSFVGEFRNNLQEGKGKLVSFEENKVIYEGHWRYG